MAGKVKPGRKPWIPTPEILSQVEGMRFVLLLRTDPPYLPLERVFLESVSKGRFLKEEQIAALIGLSNSTWFEKKKQFPELSDAIRVGRAKVAVNISNKLYEVALKGNPNLLQFLAKSVVGLKENDPQVQGEVTFNVFTNEGKERLQFSDE